jgi:hypothetical protein
MMLEIFECFRGFCSPLKFGLSLEELEEGKPRSPSLGKKQFKATMQPVSFWTSLMVAGASMAKMALIFSGLASIPWWLTMNPSSFPEGTPKTHLVGLSFHRNFRRLLKVSSRSTMN